MPGTPLDEKRDAALKMIRDGHDSHEISAKTGLSVGSIAALRAHHTMGRYPLAPEEAEHEVVEALETKFGLERDMQRALRSNIEQLESGLRIIDGGAERIVPSGRIDITAEDKSGATVVIELQAGEADRDAVAQVLSYKGDIADSNGRPARGILIAGDFSLRAISAARAVPNLELKRYSFRFSFEPAKRPET
jgi:hypothetical protein